MVNKILIASSPEYPIALSIRMVSTAIRIVDLMRASGLSRVLS